MHLNYQILTGLAQNGGYNFLCFFSKFVLASIFLLYLQCKLYVFKTVCLQCLKHVLGLERGCYGPIFGCFVIFFQYLVNFPVAIIQVDKV